MPWVQAAAVAAVGYYKAAVDVDVVAIAMVAVVVAANPAAVVVMQRD